MIASFTPAEIVADAVREVRLAAGLSAADLAERARLSPEQVSAVEAAEPAALETLVAIARALDRNPHPLLLAAGFLGERYARAALAGLFLLDQEFPDGWGGWTDPQLADARRLLTDAEVEGDAVRRLAADVFRVPGTDETRWRDRSAPAYARGTYTAEITRLIDFWGYFEYRCWESSSTPVTWESLVKTGVHVCEADLPRPASAAA